MLYSPGYSPSPLKPKKVPSNTHGTMPFSPKHQKPAASPVTNLFFDAYGDVSPEKTAKSFGKSPGLAGSSVRKGRISQKNIIHLFVYPFFFVVNSRVYILNVVGNILGLLPSFLLTHADWSRLDI